MRYSSTISARALRMLAVASSGAAACVLVLDASAAPAGKSPSFARFLSPTGNLSCEMSDQPGRVSVYCQSLKRPHSVTMSGSGQLKICRGTRCLGNPAENTPTLGYGKQRTVGRFQCRSQLSGVRCTVTSSGKGFLIDKAGARRIG